MNHKMDAAIAEIRTLGEKLRADAQGGPAAIVAALEKLAEGLEQEFHDLHREDERTKERIRNVKR
jgi:hypothetical protein